jgi:predicted metal-dependent phosphoesterase TrpH
VARLRGMDLVTITDHDSIDGCLEFLDRHGDTADFLMGEEVTCRWPGTDLIVHLGVYGLTETIHREIQPLRRNVHEAVAYLSTTPAVAVFNHPFHFYRGQVPLPDYVSLIGRTAGIETRNGAMLPAHNDLAERIGRGLTGRRAMVGGSDAHALHRIGQTWTETPAATRHEFLADLRRGQARPGGAHGSVGALAGDIYRVVACYWRALISSGYPELTPGRRVVGLAFSAATLPAQFTPLAVSLLHKRREAGTVRSAAHALGSATNAHDVSDIAREFEG